MLNRHISDSGINPFVFSVALSIIFIILSNYIFSKGSGVEYFYALIPVILASKLNDDSRNQFLKSFFSKKRYIGVRIIENMTIALPFILYLIYDGKHLTALILVVFITMMTFINFANPFNHSVPTPFYKYPFEFIVGFRKSFPLIFIAYLLAVIAIIVTNFNLGLFSLVVVLLVCLSYYTSLEEHFYVWFYSLNAKMFILNKAQILIAYTTLLCFPILLVLTIFFKEQFLQILIVQCIGYVYVLTALLSKYSNLPNRITLLEIIIFSVSLVIVPLLVFIIPYFYFKSQKRLKETLE